MNFLVINPDELRAESIGCYGHPNAPTPNINLLAEEGVRFAQCHVQHTVCTPSRCSMMTGWYPHVRGHRTLWHMLRPDEPNLMKYLMEAGYDVRWYGKNDLLAAASFESSTREAVHCAGARYGKNVFDRRDPRYYSFLQAPYQGPEARHIDVRRVNRAIHFLKSKPTEPFFLFLPVDFPHCPYSAPPRWHDAVDPAGLPALRPAGLPNKPDFHHLIRKTRRLDELDGDFFRKLNAVYLGMIGWVDEWLGQLMNTLEETGLAANTCVLFFSDHGDYAGDYGLVEKWPSGLEDTLTRVPFIVRLPGGAKHHVIHEQVELFDFMATVLALAGIEAQHTHFARNLVPQLHGASGDPERVIFAEGGYDPHEPHCFEGRRDSSQPYAGDETHMYYPKCHLQQIHPESVCRSVMLRTLSHKLIHRTRGVHELYDLKKDPRELHNVYGDGQYASVQADLEHTMLQWHVQTADVTPFEEDSRGFPRMPHPSP